MENIAEQKVIKPVIERTVAIHGGKNQKNKCVAVVHYKFDRRSKELAYGATIFKAKNKDDKFVYAKHAVTAKSRFDDNPIKVTMQVDDRNIKVFHKKIRALPCKYGCRSHNNNSDKS